jgi:hypothetical protein
MDRKILILPLAMSLLLFFSCATRTNTVTEYYVPEDFAGIAPYDGWQLADDDYAVIDDLGVSWFRRTFFWETIEKVQGEWNFSNYDVYVDDAKTHDKKLLAILAYGAPWLPHSKPDEVTKEDLPLYLNYIREIVGRYKGRIDAYEIWNEPNMSRMWKGSRKDFINLVKAAVSTVREVDPNAIILTGGFARVPASLIKEMFAAGAFDGVDAVSFHPYAVSPGAVVRLYDKIEALVRKHGFTGDIWVTEIGYPTAGWYPHRTSLKKLPGYIERTLTGLASRGAKKIFWYELFDEFNPGEELSKSNSEDFFGLVYPNHSYKEGAHAYAKTVKKLAGTTVPAR